MLENSTSIDARPAGVRSAVTNGRRMFVRGDGRGPWARRWRDLVELHICDLAAGAGAAALTEAQLSLIRRASTIEIQLEDMEGRLSQGEDGDLDKYTRASGHLRRILETLGLERRATDVTLLDQYREMLAAQRADDAAGSADHTEYQSTEENAPAAACEAVAGTE
jgi:DnaJ-domain-containing protein 1